MFLMPLQNGIYYPDTYQPITSHLHTSYLFLTRDFLFTYIQILLGKKGTDYGNRTLMLYLVYGFKKPQNREH